MGRTSHLTLSAHDSNKEAEDSSNPSGSIGVDESSTICIRPQGEVYEILGLREDISDDNSISYHLSRQSLADVPKPLLDKFLVRDAPNHLCNSGGGGTDKRQVHLVVSTRSGTGLALDFYKSVLQPLLTDFGLPAPTVPGDDKSHNLGLNLVVTRDAQSIREFAASLAPKGEHTVVLMSGDGGIVESLNGKAPTDENKGGAASSGRRLPLIAMLPLGTGNALFNSLHKGVYTASGVSAPSPLVLGLRTLLRGVSVPLPSFRVDFSPGSRQISYRDAASAGGSAPGAVEEQLSPVNHLYGAIVASYGFHAQLVWESDTPEYRKHGAKRFGMVAAELLKESHGYDALVERRHVSTSTASSSLGPTGPPEPIHRPRHAYVLATLVSNLERTFTISPASRPLDGALRLVHFGPVGGERTMEIMTQAYNEGRHVGMTWTTTAVTGGGEGEEEMQDGVGYEQIGEVRVVTHEEDARWRKVCVDGTIVELPLEGSMTVRTESAPHLEILVDPSVTASTASLEEV
ncbi:cortical actin cytoskeleton protein vip1 [Apiospora arundinis]